MKSNILQLLELANKTCDDLCKDLKPKKAKLVSDAAVEMARVLLTETFGEEALEDAVKMKLDDLEKEIKVSFSSLLGIDPDCIQFEGPVDIEPIEVKQAGIIHMDAAEGHENEAETELINELTQIVKSMKPGQKAMLTITKGSKPKRKMLHFEA